MKGSEAIRGIPAPEPTPMTVSDALDRFYRLGCGRWCPKRQENNLRVFRGWLDILPPIPLSAINSVHVEALYLARNDGTRRGVTLNGERGMLRSFFLWADRHRLITSNPAHAWPLITGKASKPSRVYCNLKPLEEPLLNALNQEHGWSKRTPRERRVAILRFTVMAMCMGLRRAIVHRARWEWVSADWFLTVPGTFCKNGEPLRLPIPSKVLAVLGQRKGPQDPLIPGLPFEPATINRILKKAARLAGIDPKIVYPHQCRRTMVDFLLQQGVPDAYIQKLGQWHQAETMRKHYTCGLKDEIAKEILEKM